MLSVARLRPSSAARGYYERAAAKDADWAAWTGAPVSEWAGRARAALAREGAVQPGELTRLLLGADPATGAPLRPTAPLRTLPRGRSGPPGAGVPHRPATARPVAGFDLVFSAPKSISLMLAIAEDEACGVAAAHRLAWQDALEFLEAHACVVRRTGTGVTGIGYVGAAYAHYANRDGDPHLHTHVVIANQTQAIDDPSRWRALDAVPLLVGWRRAARAIYEARLRYELTMRFGVAWHRTPGGGLELAAITRAAIRATSGRAAAVRAHAGRHGVRTAYGARVAGQATRAPRRAFGCQDRRLVWRQRALALGLDDRARAALFGAGRRPAAWPTPEPDPELLGERGLTATSQTFTHAELVAALADQVPDGATSAAVWERAARTARLAVVTGIGAARVGRPSRYTTEEILTLEAQVILRAEAGRGAGTDRARPEDLAAVLAFDRQRLSDEQAQAAEYAAAPEDRIACIVGGAGSGKTTALAAAARALWASGIPVTGCAPSAQAAHVLQDTTGMPSATLHALCARWESGTAAPAGCVIVDEASMADTRTLARLVAITEQRARIVLVGDDRQLPAVGPGGLFTELAARLGAVELVANRRQTAGWERDALALLRSGRSDAALAVWAAHDRIHLAADPVYACAAAWWADRAASGATDTVMLAYRRRDVAMLNAAAAAALDVAGRRGRRVGVGTPAFAVGDCIRCRINDPRAGLRNGMRGTIAGVDPDRGVITLDAEDGTRVEIPREYRQADGIEHAWALTGHAAQGITVARAFVVAPEPGAHAEWGYVALSRAREAVHLFVVADPDADPLAELAVSLRSRAARPPARVQAQRVPERAVGEPPPPERTVRDPGAHEGARDHKPALTRQIVLGR
jgi:conjugative relaxase-like TrwC/TraI family protein